MYGNALTVCPTQLPPNFFRSLDQLMDADLLIVMGTSLTVHPFASLINMVKGKCPRVLIMVPVVSAVLGLSLHVPSMAVVLLSSQRKSRATPKVLFGARREDGTVVN
jgi:NAD-dependent SIR2 family protein deacetylase